MLSWLCLSYHVHSLLCRILPRENRTWPSVETFEKYHDFTSGACMVHNDGNDCWFVLLFYITHILILSLSSAFLSTAAQDQATEQVRGSSSMPMPSWCPWRWHPYAMPIVLRRDIAGHFGGSSSLVVKAFDIRLHDGASSIDQYTVIPDQYVMQWLLQHISCYYYYN